jgi:hypothetical protein
MRLTDQQVTEYQLIYKQVFGKAISKDDALSQGLALLGLMKELHKYTNEDKNENLNAKKYSPAKN